MAAVPRAVEVVKPRLFPEPYHTSVCTGQMWVTSFLLAIEIALTGERIHDQCFVCGHKGAHYQPALQLYPQEWNHFIRDSKTARISRKLYNIFSLTAIGVYNGDFMKFEHGVSAITLAGGPALYGSLAAPTYMQTLCSGRQQHSAAANSALCSGSQAVFSGSPPYAAALLQHSQTRHSGNLTMQRQLGGNHVQVMFGSVVLSRGISAAIPSLMSLDLATAMTSSLLPFLSIQVST
ncbi:hypothetical protein DFH08DRAFT_821916 [Mycena albidolilacea]|uniref:Uncharacterized protein n=1 Tax=Mycena albidolilacea TaxID=1033008 RepID=A0AAD6Z9A1_9AGAR|nr:hypothetical protein DFH08DRAFT_821916 [Mycena albidolilacea]